MRIEKSMAVAAAAEKSAGKRRHMADSRARRDGVQSQVEGSGCKEARVRGGQRIGEPGSMGGRPGGCRKCASVCEISLTFGMPWSVA